jgi:hypothetical protein
LLVPAVRVARKAARHSRCVNHHEHRPRSGHFGKWNRGTVPGECPRAIRSQKRQGRAGPLSRDGHAVESPTTVLINDRLPG